MVGKYTLVFTNPALRLLSDYPRPICLACAIRFTVMFLQLFLLTAPEARIATNKRWVVFVKLTFSWVFPSLILTILQGMLTEAKVLGCAEMKLTVTSLAQPGCRWPIQGENVISGGGVQWNRIGSDGE